MFGFLLLLIPIDQKIYGYQNPHLLFLMQVWLSHDVRELVLWWWMHGLDGHTKLMHRYQESLVGGPPCFGVLENSANGLVTISKLTFSLHAFTQIIFLACFVFVLHVENTFLDVVFIKTCVYTYTSSELHLIIRCLCFTAHLYSLYVHV